MNKKGDMILRQIRTYSKDMDKLGDDFKEMSGNYEDKKNKNKEIINKYQISCQGQLDEISDVIGQHIGKLQQMIARKDNLLKNKINEYKQEVNMVKIKEDNLVKELDITIDNLQDSVDKEKHHFKEEIVLCEDVVKKYGSYDDYENGQDQRQKELEKIGQDAEIYYDEKMQEINSDKAKITEFINRKPVKHDENEEVYTVTVDKGLFDEIWDDMNNYISIKSLNEQAEGTLYC